MEISFFVPSTPQSAHAKTFEALVSWWRELKKLAVAKEL
jgi:hypothetical protein